MAKSKKFSSGGPVSQHYEYATTGRVDGSTSAHKGTKSTERYAKGGRVGAGSKKDKC